MRKLLFGAGIISLSSLLIFGCPSKEQVKSTGGAGGFEDAAKKVYVPPGQYDEFYAFLSGGFNGQLSVYGLPSGRLLKIIPVFSQFPENGYGYTPETKPMLMTSYGFVPWDDSATTLSYLKLTVHQTEDGFS